MSNIIKKSPENNVNIKNGVYLTHFNGGRIFKVVIVDKMVKVYLNYQSEIEIDKMDGIEEGSLLHVFDVENVFIGKSKKNAISFSGGYGPKFDGNSILLEMGENQYIFIGNLIYSFTSLSKIIEYHSPVGNNDVPYPYAIDEDKNIYLMIEDTILTKTTKSIITNPYEYYYDGQIITIGDFSNRYPITRNFQGIKKVQREEESICSLNYSSFPEKYYKRLTNPYPNEKNVIAYLKRYNMLDKLDKKRRVFIEYTNEKIEELTLEKYLEINQNFATKMGFIPFTKTVLTKSVV